MTGQASKIDEAVKEGQGQVGTTKTELFAKMPLSLWQNGFIREMSGSAMKVLVLLMMRADFEKKTCWPSITTIANNTGLSWPSVSSAIGNLCELGLVRKQKRKRSFSYELLKPEKWKINLYRNSKGDDCHDSNSKESLQNDSKDILQCDTNSKENCEQVSNNFRVEYKETLDKQDTIELKPTTTKPHYAKLPTEGTVDMAAYADMGVEEVEILNECSGVAVVDKNINNCDKHGSGEPKAKPVEPDREIEAIVRTFFNRGDNAGRRKSVNREDAIRKWATQRLVDYPVGSIIMAIADSSWAVRPEGVDKQLLTMKTRSVQLAEWQHREARKLARIEQDKARAAEIEKMKAIPPKTTAEKIAMYRKKIKWVQGSNPTMVPFFEQRIRELEEESEN